MVLRTIAALRAWGGKKCWPGPWQTDQPNVLWMCYAFSFNTREKKLLEGVWYYTYYIDK